jgi:hypothetical protein
LAASERRTERERESERERERERKEMVGGTGGYEDEKR